MTMTLGLASCGGVDTTDASEKFNSAVTKLNEISGIANTNSSLIGLFDQEMIDEMVAMTEEMADLKAELESEDITQERADEIKYKSEKYMTDINDFEKRIKEIVDNPVNVKINEIIDIVIVLTDEYNKITTIALENGWEADELTNQEINALAGFLEKAQGDEFVSEVSALQESDVDALLQECKNLQSAMPELSDRVSQPYTDEK